MGRSLKNPDRSARPRAPSARRDEVRAVACEVIADKGYRATTMADIAEASGILGGSLYYHFGTKDVVLTETLSEYWTDLLAELNVAAKRSDGPMEALVGLIEVSLRFLVERPAETTVLYNDWAHLSTLSAYELNHDASEKVEKIWATVICRATRAGLTRQDLDPVICFRMIQGSILSTIRWYESTGPVDRAALARHHIDMVLDGFRAHSAPVT
jgi:AcrR family transcriptional regulator